MDNFLNVSVCNLLIVVLSGVRCKRKQTQFLLNGFTPRGTEWCNSFLAAHIYEEYLECRNKESIKRLLHCTMAMIRKDNL